MALNFQLQLVDGITPGARSAKRALDQLDAQLRVVDRDLDMSARKRAQAQARQLQGDRQTAAQSRAGVASRARDVNDLVRLEERAGAARVRAVRRTEDEINRSLNRQLANEERAERQRQSRYTRNQQRAAREGTRGALGMAGGALRAVGGAGAALLAGVGQYGDEQRQRNQAQQQLDFQIQQLASSGIGNGALAPQLAAAIRRTAIGTGANVNDLLGGLTMAQGRFGALNDAGGRDAWLREGGVLEQLTHTALGAGSSLEDVVATAGELQRQLNIAPTALPDTLAQMIVMGRQGSVEFSDFAQHFGQLAGMSRRFLRAGTAQESAAANALTGTLYQFAGRAGLDGAEGATSTRSLLQNITSARGQRRLNAALGTSAFDAQGQLRAGAGQGQDDAFIRMVESLYTRTRGNSVAFTQALAGNNVEAGAVVNQLFQDLVQNQGHLTGFRQLEAGSRGATAANTQERAFADLQNTPAMRRAREETQLLFQQNLGAFAAATNQTEEQLRQAALANPMLARALNAPGVSLLTHGAMDTANYQLRNMGTVGGSALTGGRLPGWMGVQSAQGSWAQLAWEQSRQRASAEHDAGLAGVVRNAGETEAGRNQQINARAAEIYAERLQQETGAGRNVARGLTLAQDSLTGMQNAVREGVMAAMAQGGGANGAGGSTPGGGGVFRAWLQGGD